MCCVHMITHSRTEESRTMGKSSQNLFGIKSVDAQPSQPSIKVKTILPPLRWVSELLRSVISVSKGIKTGK